MNNGLGSGSRAPLAQVKSAGWPGTNPPHFMPESPVSAIFFFRVDEDAGSYNRDNGGNERTRCNFLFAP